MCLLALCRTCFFFFFSSRRRHTRFDCDWSSDVCSSDLAAVNVYFHTFGCKANQYDTALVRQAFADQGVVVVDDPAAARSEEHTSELQSQSNLVCRLLLEKKKKQKRHNGICRTIVQV